VTYYIICNREKTKFFWYNIREGYALICTRIAMARFFKTLEEAKTLLHQPATYEHWGDQIVADFLVDAVIAEVTLSILSE